MNREPITHDFTRSLWGHSIGLVKEVNDNESVLLGHGEGIRAGDFIKMKSTSGENSFKVKEISYYRDPSDMFRAVVFHSQVEAVEVHP